MEPDDSGLNSYYLQQPPPPPPQHHQSPATAPAPSNGILQSAHMLVYTPSALETGVKRKRGRPRKYVTPEQAAAAKRVSSSSSSLPSSSSVPISPPPKKKKENQSLGVSGGGSKKSQLAAFGSMGQGFTPHMISVAAGEDVAQKIMLFMQQSKREICILSASGAISNPSLRQPATSGGNITYEGQFDILSLCGSYIRTNLGGRTGGISVSLASTDGQMIGGGIGGPMKAAGPVQVIVATFLIDTKKDIAGAATAAGGGVKVGDVSATSNLPSSPSPVGGGSGGVSVSGVGFQTTIDNHHHHHQIMGGGNHFINQPQPQHIPMSTPSRSSPEWGSANVRSNSNYELAGRTGGSLSQENGNYE